MVAEADEEREPSAGWATDDEPSAVARVVKSRQVWLNRRREELAEMRSEIDEEKRWSVPSHVFILATLPAFIIIGLWGTWLTTLGYLVVLSLGWAWVQGVNRRTGGLLLASGPPVVVACVAAVVIAVPQAAVGVPAEHHLASGLADGVYAQIVQDDTYTYLWPCEAPADDAQVVAIPTAQIERVHYLPTQPPRRTLADLLRGQADPLGPTLKCGGAA